MRRIDRGETVGAVERRGVLAPAVREVVRRQKEAGVDIVSDGEFGKSSWNYYVYRRLGGIELRPPQHEVFEGAVGHRHRLGAGSVSSTPSTFPRSRILRTR